MTTTTVIDPDVAAVFNLVARRTFTEFTQVDWWAWAGCVTEIPMVSYGETEEEPTIIIDGDRVIVFSHTDKQEYHLIGELLLP